MLLPETLKIQNDLGSYCRSGKLPTIPGINEKHAKHYRRLVFNIIKNNLTRAFPIATKVKGENGFIEMIDRFFREYAPQTPQIWKLPVEFYHYVLSENWAGEYDMPWLNDLLLMEWMELHVYTMSDRKIPDYRKEGDTLHDTIILNPDHEIISLHYPVHLMPVKNTPDNQGDYYLLVYRHQQFHHVRFINLSPLFNLILAGIVNKKSLDVLISEACQSFKLLRDHITDKAVTTFISELYKNGFVLGFQVDA